MQETDEKADFTAVVTDLRQVKVKEIYLTLRRSS